jgi:hypothetical protein
MFKKDDVVYREQPLLLLQTLDSKQSAVCCSYCMKYVGDWEIQVFSHCTPVFTVQSALSFVTPVYFLMLYYLRVKFSRLILNSAILLSELIVQLARLLRKCFKMDSGCAVLIVIARIPINAYAVMKFIVV